MSDAVICTLICAGVVFFLVAAFVFYLLCSGGDFEWVEWQAKFKDAVIRLRAEKRSRARSRRVRPQVTGPKPAVGHGKKDASSNAEPKSGCRS